MAKRFSRLQWASKADLSGAAITKYKAYRGGSSEVTYTRGASSNPGQLVLLYLNPFGVPAADIYQIRASKRAIDGMGTVINDTGLLNHKTTPANLSGVIDSPSFQPAKAIVTKAGTGTTTETSKITGLQYKKRTGVATYTLPFGSAGGDNATSKYLAVATSIQASVEAKNPDYGVTFKPEFF